MGGGLREDERTGGGGDPAAGSRSGRLPGAGVEGLAGGREFDLIRGFYPAAEGDRADVVVGAGDDAAVVRGDGVVISTDMSVEGVHFRRDWLTPREIGYRAATAALSDLAAMAARPIGVLVSLALPEADAGPVAVEVMTGVREAAERVGGTVLGGDVARTPGVLALDVVAVGESAAPVLRSGARPGDEVWVTGWLGGAGWAAERLLSGAVPEPAAYERFRAPVARTREAGWLAERSIPAAMLDLSDGLAGDAGHLARAGGVAVVLDEAAIPVLPALARALPPERAAALALSGGEDYELVFAARPGAVDPHRSDFEAAFGCPLTRVGRVDEGEGVVLRARSGETRALDEGGYQHFRS